MTEIFVEPNGAERSIRKDGREVTRPTASLWGRVAASGAVVQVAAAFCGICGVAIVLLSTMRYGASLSPDSGAYLSAARSLLAGNGYVCWNGQVYSQWPPLFPTLLAGLDRLGVDMKAGARILNAVAFGLIVFLSGRLLARSTTTRGFAIVGTLSILVSIHLLGVAVRLLSEPVFVVLVLLFLLYLPAFLQTGRPRSLVWVSILAGLACLQRYAGIATILTGAILIVLSMRGFSLRRRLVYIAGFGVLSGSPLALWFLRNRLVAGQTAGNHHLHLITLDEVRQALMSAGYFVSTWLFSESFSASVRWLGPAVIAGMVILAVVLWRRRSSDASDTKRLQIRCAAVYGVVYFAFLVFSAAGLGWPPEPRLIAPMYVSFMLLAVVALEDVCKWLGRVVRSVPVVETLCLLLCLVWLSGRLPLVRRTVAAYMKNGTGGYCTAGWQESSFMNWLLKNPPKGRIYSNAAEGIYLLTGTIAEPTLNYTISTIELAKKMSAQTSYIAWFYKDYYWDKLFDLPELLSRYEMEEEIGFPDGELYRVSGAVKPEPWLWAVYHLRSPAMHQQCYATRLEGDKLLGGTAGWTFEGTSFYAFAEPKPGTHPVYHLCSVALQAHFYTMDEAEKDSLLHVTSDAWVLQGIAFYAYRERSQKDLLPVCRLWSRRSGDCFLTTDERERGSFMDSASSEWTDIRVIGYVPGS